MDKEPMLSICIASYNYARCLRRAFASIKCQDYKDYEIIYCDDCSDDNSVEIIKGLIQSFPDVSISLIINETNRGLIYTKNRLLENANGKYVMLCDADDFMKPGCLKALMENACIYDADRVCAQVEDIGPDGKIIQIQDIAQNQSKWLWNIHHGCIYRRKLICDNDIKIEHYPDDVDLSLKVCNYAKKTVWVRQNLYVWNIHTDSTGKQWTSATQSQKEFSEICDVLESAVTKAKDSPTSEIFEQGNKLENIEQIKFLYLKLYYLYILQYSKSVSWKQRKKKYKLLKSVICDKYPQYLENRYIKQSDGVVRKYAHRIVYICATLEKIHLIVPALWAYHMLSKIIYFDQ